MLIEVEGLLWSPEQTQHFFTEDSQLAFHFFVMEAEGVSEGLDGSFSMDNVH